MNDASRAQDILKEHRKSIDRLDSIMVYALAERFATTKKVGQMKAEYNLPPADPAREKEQIQRLRELAVEADLDPEFAEKFLTFIINEVVKNHKTYQSDSELNAD